MISLFCFLFACPLIWAAAYQLGFTKGARWERGATLESIRQLRHAEKDAYSKPIPRH